MKLKEAIEKLKEGQWASMGDWSEYSVQFELIDGAVYWITGRRAGIVKNLDTFLDTFNNSSNDWKIYDNWKGKVIEESKE
jgi:hypothetical protein